MSTPESEPQAAPTDVPSSEPERDETRLRLEEALVEIKRVIAGQDEMLERVLVCLVAGGHLLRHTPSRLPSDQLRLARHPGKFARRERFAPCAAARSAVTSRRRGEVHVRSGSGPA